MLAWCDGEQLGRRRVQHPPQVLPPVSSPFLVHLPLSRYPSLALVGSCGGSSFRPRQRLVQRRKSLPPLTGARSSSWSVTDLHPAHCDNHARAERSVRRRARYARRLVRQQREHDDLSLMSVHLFLLCEVRNLTPPVHPGLAIAKLLGASAALLPRLLLHRQHVRHCVSQAACVPRGHSIFDYLPRPAPFGCRLKVIGVCYLIYPEVVEGRFYRNVGLQVRCPPLILPARRLTSGIVTELQKIATSR